MKLELRFFGWSSPSSSQILRFNRRLIPLYLRAYTVPVNFGSKDQEFSLQIDTGSSDLVSVIYLMSWNRFQVIY